MNLSASTGRRKAVLFIGPGWNLWSPAAGSEGWSPAAVDAGVAARKMSGVFDDVNRTAKRNNVRIYPISPEGFTVTPGSTLAGGDAGGDGAASLRILAADTGGIAIANQRRERRADAR